MKKNTEFDLFGLSLRAQEFLKNPLFEKTTEQTFGENVLRWEFRLEAGPTNDFQSDKIVALLYSFPGAKEIEKLFLESLSRLIVGKSVVFLETLLFRELENYLRDENHLPAFGPSLESTSQDIYEETYQRVKKSLLVSLVFQKIGPFPAETVVKNSWDQLSLVVKNAEISKMIMAINGLYPQFRPIELVLVEDTTIFLVLNESPLAVDVLEKVCDERFHFTNDKSSFKVVAVQ